MNKTIEQTWHFDQPVELVWEYLTKPELLSQWLMESDFKLEIGHEFQFDTKPKVKLGFDGHIFCKVLSFELHKSLSYSWKGGPGPGKITLDSVVTWTLQANGEGTILHLEHRGFKGVRNYLPYLIMGKGWEINIQRKLGERLQNHANTQ
ncbi:SRPBCC domain-containing protein [Marinilongibacter aquaticus]|uniref:SRPBCC family protein n=1 Tax=Marinilongibacter aquaticus TaxID=2975157 RepID=UPI0021BD2D79|nr:SRPBCC domain-containing protein [Marinilongibacter aquaticus]UBM59717.1 SRPBCC domain-containing protein [Marinilongibacter aquaticus]